MKDGKKSVSEIGKNDPVNKCRAALRQGPGKMECVTITKPELIEGKVLIRVLHVGICGSDIARVKDPDKKWDKVVLGHEAVGEVEEISKSASAGSLLKKGGRVAIIPLVPCRKCYFCLKGMHSSCKSYSFIGSRVNGTLSDYLMVEPTNLLKLPEDDNIEKYTFLEPLTVALHAIYQTDIKFGKTAVVFGAGAIGLLLFQVLKNLANYEVIMVDIDKFKLGLARKLGSFHNVDLTNESLEEYIKENIDSAGVDTIFEVSGANEARTGAIQVSKPGGSIVLIGTSPKDTIFDAKTFELITRKELKLTGSWMSYSGPFPGREWETGIKILKNNLIDIDTLITQRYKLSSVSAAFKMILENDEKYCKVLINI